METNAAEPLFDAQSEAFDKAEAAGPVQDPLKLYVRAIGDGRLLTAVEERELARLKDEGDEGARRKLDRVEPPARDVDHPQLHAGGRRRCST